MNIENLDEKEIVRQIYLGMLDREPDEEGLKVYIELLNKGQISDVIRSIKKSAEFYMRFHDIPHHMTAASHIGYLYQEPAIVFIHIPKTAGQSLHYLFKQKYKKVSPLFNSLSLLTVNFAYSYDVIFGHTDYTTAKLVVQRKKVRFITFLRDPIKRLISLYKFWWSHDPQRHNRNVAVQLANKYSPEEFFQASEVVDILWNDMFGRFVGYGIRDRLRKMLQGMDESLKNSYLQRFVVPLIRQRLDEYFFVGLQEHFVEDALAMFQKLGVDCLYSDVVNAKINVTENNIGQSGFKSEKLNFQLTDSLLESLKRLTELDDLLYRQALESETLRRRVYEVF